MSVVLSPASVLHLYKSSPPLQYVPSRRHQGHGSESSYFVVKAYLFPQSRLDSKPSNSPLIGIAAKPRQRLQARGVIRKAALMGHGIEV